MTVAMAAEVLGVSAGALRRALQRAAGTGEVSFDGVRARKLGARWRVALSSDWTRADVERTSSTDGGHEHGA
jgi:hypothetical protein